MVADPFAPVRSLAARFARIEAEHDRQVADALAAVLYAARQALDGCKVRRKSIEEDRLRGRIRNQFAVDATFKIDEEAKVAARTIREATTLQRLWPHRHAPMEPRRELARLPAALDSERALVGALLFDAKAPMPPASDFLHPLLAVAVELAAVDWLGVPQAMMDRWPAKGREILLLLAECMEVASVAPHHAKRVRDAAEARRRLEAMDGERAAILDAWTPPPAPEGPAASR